LAFMKSSTALLSLMLLVYYYFPQSASSQWPVFFCVLSSILEMSTALLFARPDEEMRADRISKNAVVEEVYRYPCSNNRSAVRAKPSAEGIATSSASAMRSMMLKRAQTTRASSMACSLTPTARSGAISPGPTSPGANVTFSNKPNVTRSFSSIGAVCQLSRTAATFSSVSTFDATAPWAPVQ
jgi:hypothetical protein